MLKHLDIEVFDAVSPFALRITNVAQKAKDVLVEPVLLLIASVKGLVIVEPGVQVSQGLVGSVAATKSKSFEVQLLGEGKVCADDLIEVRIRKTKQQTLKDWNK